MKTLPLTCLMTLALLPGMTYAEEAGLYGEKGCAADYAKAPDGTARYVPIRNFMCKAIWECDGLLVCTVGSTGKETENGRLYFSPLIWALFDYRNFNTTRCDLDHPCIQGNTPEKARALVIRLIEENRNNCVNDSVDAYITPLLLACDDDELILMLLKKGADPNKARWLHGTTLLYLAAQRGSVEVVRALLSHGADPSFEANPELKSILSAYDIAGQNDLRKLKCLALIAEAQTRWKK